MMLEPQSRCQSWWVEFSTKIRSLWLFSLFLSWAMLARRPARLCNINYSCLELWLSCHLLVQQLSTTDWLKRAADLNIFWIYILYTAAVFWKQTESVFKLLVKKWLLKSQYVLLVCITQSCLFFVCFVIACVLSDLNISHYKPLALLCFYLW